MRDLATVMWKEVADLTGNRRSLLVFTFAVLVVGIVPTLTLVKHHGQISVGNASIGVIFLLIYVLMATMIVVAQTAPDLVLRERLGHTFDYLLTTRLSDRSIFGAKVIISFAIGYLAAMLALFVQLLATSLFGGAGWQWLFLSEPLGRIGAFGMTADLSLYVAVIGTFIALRVGEQRSAYMVSVLGVGLLFVPFAVGWLHFSLTLQWVTHAAVVFGAISVALALLGLRVFRRDMLVFYLRDES